ncbi:MAG: outer membrane protein assembly factor [Candidatus Eisenbacteria bacterium]
MRAHLACVLAAAIVAASTPVANATSVLRLGIRCETHAVHYRWIGPHELPQTVLEKQVSTRGEGAFTGLHHMVAWLPLVPDPTPHPFQPLALQEDVARLRQLYAREGFPDAGVDYEVKTDDTRRLVTVTLVIREGEPIRVRRLGVRLVDPSRAGEVDAREVNRARKKLLKYEREALDNRLGAAGIDGLRSAVRQWLANLGYLGARVDDSTVVDTAARVADVMLRVDPGLRARVASIAVTTDPPIDPKLATRHLPFTSGDWVSTSSMVRGQQNLRSVDLFRDASVEVPTASIGDSAVPVQVTIRQSTARLTGLAVGYVSSGAGISAQTGWTHPNLTGGARCVDLVGLVQTGWWNLGELPDRLLRLTLTMRQPYVGSPAASVSFGPKLEYRDDDRERSAQVSMLVTYVYPFSLLQSLSLTFDQSYKHIIDLRFGGVSLTGSQVTALVGDNVLAGVKQARNTQQWTLAMRRGVLDNATLPRRGITVRPTLTITGPPAMSDVQFQRVDLMSTAFLPVPIGRSALLLRATVGRLWPSGSSIPPPDSSGTIEFIRLRDYMFTAGGSGDVRGYDTGLLGPKYPHLDVGSDGHTLVSDYYDPLGGLARAAVTAELRLPLPGARPELSGHVFLDAGRVWTPDDRYKIALLTSDETRWFMTTGAGLGYYSPIGAMRLEGGYQLNPSILDLRSPNDVVKALVAGLPPSAAPTNQWRRFRLHLSLGVWF